MYNFPMLTPTEQATIALAVPAFQERLEVLFNLLHAEGVYMHPYCTRRSLEAQAKFFRQSRSGIEIDARITSLKQSGYGYLADVLHNVGPQPKGPKVTAAGPGQSWHNFGEAMDAAPLIDGKIVWDNEHPAWQKYGSCVVKAGLTWAGHWATTKEFPHCQLRASSNPLSELTPAEVKNTLSTLGMLKNS